MPRLDYFAPGVYVEEINRGSRPIEGVSTNVAGFVGFTEDIRNDAELYKPMLVTNWSQYRHYFGKEGSDGFTDFKAYLPFAVNGFFLNGGGRCWICSIGTHLPGKQPPPEQLGLEIPTRGKNRPALRLNFKNPKANLPSLTIEIEDGKPKALPPNTEGEPPEDTKEYFNIIVKQGDRILERFDNLTMNREADTQVADYVVNRLAQSQILQVVDISQVGRPLARKPLTGSFQLNLPQVVSPENLTRDMKGSQDDRTGVRGMFEIDEINILACPDLMRVYQEGLISLEQVHDVMGLQIGLCEGSMSGNVPNPPNRMVVLDTPPDKVKPQEVAQWLEDSQLCSMFAALYYPWIKVTNPKVTNPKDPEATIYIPPCGHVMGVWSRNDETRGVYKAPANEVPRGVIDLAYDTNFREQELLNPKGINCIRKFPNRGIRIWGARTLVEPDVTEWRYINVRRLISYIEKSIELGTQWVVFEPNDEDLWARVTRVVTNFLERLWREGALFGASPEQAFYVKCDSELNTPETMMLGRLYVEVGVCPVRPAEFVIFRISQWNSSDGA